MQNIDLRDIDFYSENMIFIEPSIIINPVNCSCLSLRLKLNHFVKTCKDPLRMLLSMLSRTRNRFVFLKELREAILAQKITLMQVSTLFTKVNSIYKQASIERQNYKKKSP